MIRKLADSHKALPQPDAILAQVNFILPQRKPSVELNILATWPIVRDNICCWNVAVNHRKHQGIAEILDMVLDGS